MDREPDNTDRIYEHAQSVYWAGYVPYRKRSYLEAENYFLDYIHHAENLKRLEPTSLRGSQEITYAYTNFGILLKEQKKYEQAQKYYLKALPSYIKISDNHPENLRLREDLANAYAWLADINKITDPVKRLEYRILQNSIYAELLKEFPYDLNLKHRSLGGSSGLAISKYHLGDFEETRKIVLKAIPHAINLVDRDSENTEWLSTLTTLQLILAETSLAQKMYSNAKADFLKLSEYEGRLKKLTDGEARYFNHNEHRANAGRLKLASRLK